MYSNNIKKTKYNITSNLNNNNNVDKVIGKINKTKHANDNFSCTDILIPSFVIGSIIFALFLPKLFEIGLSKFINRGSRIEKDVLSLTEMASVAEWDSYDSTSIVNNYIKKDSLPLSGKTLVTERNSHDLTSIVVKRNQKLNFKRNYNFAISNEKDDEILKSWNLYDELYYGYINYENNGYRYQYKHSRCFYSKSLNKYVRALHISREYSELNDIEFEINYVTRVLSKNYNGRFYISKITNKRIEWIIEGTDLNSTFESGHHIFSALFRSIRT